MGEVTREDYIRLRHIVKSLIHQIKRYIRDDNPRLERVLTELRSIETVLFDGIFYDSFRTDTYNTMVTLYDKYVSEFDSIVLQ